MFINVRNFIKMCYFNEEYGWTQQYKREILITAQSKDYIDILNVFKSINFTKMIPIIISGFFVVDGLACPFYILWGSAEYHIWKITCKQIPNFPTSHSLQLLTLLC